jgi:hypothetical protein
MAEVDPDVQKCRERYANIKKNKIRRCNKRHDEGSAAHEKCLA